VSTSDLPVLPGSQIPLRCPCGQLNEAEPSARDLRCIGCNQSWWFAACPQCKSSVMLRPESVRYTCPWCDESVDVRWGKRQLVLPIRASAHGAQLAQRGIDHTRGDRLIFGLTTVGGYGWAPEPGTRISLVVCPDHLAITPVPLDAGPAVLVRFEELIAFDLQGGAWKRGKAVIGGGIGAAGIVGGLIVASVLNRLMSRSGVNTVLRISATNGELFAHHGSLVPNDLRTQLGPAVNAIAARHNATQPTGAPSVSDDFIEQLERLGQLRANGTLTEEEFEIGKHRILRNR
jgi:hypothetical protein